ncbi:MarR family winged helix-turn-helix transcriptional regulator [Chitinimonas koreensis]|uniref:MarR family winged helix-turn-helix transcriptional regulator n=1 Tax=Chitinimonas koreensis TaxID=356302 RepID=UPI0003FFC57D|nr:MarR family transcriptional regulator [Chitinimonas koreensis]QNM98698.1 MarR family transcriptional regulator [Chitinimonas koreensis]
MHKSASPQALDVEVLKQFRLIFQSVRKHFQAVETACGISGAQLWALSRIVERPGLRVTELAAAMAIHQSTASNLIESLVRQELICRRKGEVDQRAVCLHPTEAGRQIIEGAPRPVRGLLPEALGRLDPASLQGLHAQLAALIQLMGGAVDEADPSLPLSELAIRDESVRA